MDDRGGERLRVRIICQICGVLGILDTEKPIGEGGDPAWTDFPINEVVTGLSKYATYEIWICPKCQPGEYSSEIDGDTGETIGGFDIDFEQLEMKLRVPIDELALEQSP